MTDLAHTLTPDPQDVVGDELGPETRLCQGQYTVLHYLNSGGFGVTYLAHDSLGRKVVIKECFPGAMCCRTKGTVRLRSRAHGVDFTRVVALFEREARALARLQHPNIVGVHQIFKDNGTAYMALDFVAGADLLHLLDTTPEMFTPPEVRRILGQLLDALAYVHGNGILHRDISPDNILLGPDEVPVLIDFGAAREGAARATRVLSQIHTVKDGYSPQEFYLGGGEQEKSSDLYALAATMHHLITGSAPPNSNTRLAAVAQHNKDPYIPLLGRVPGYDDAFLGAMDTCLSLFPKDRLPTAEHWSEAIAHRSLSTPLSVHPVMPGPPQPDAPHFEESLLNKISALVTETSEAIASAAPEPEVTASPQPAGPKPDTAAAERAYWAILNEDPEQIRAMTRSGQDEPLLVTQRVAGQLSGPLPSGESHEDAFAVSDDEFPPLVSAESLAPRRQKLRRLSIWRFLTGRHASQA